MKPKKQLKLHNQEKMYGTTTLGARGQVVIPAEARKELNLRPGDQLLVMGRFGKVLGLIKSDQLDELIELVMQTIPESKHKLKQHIRNHLLQVFGK